MDGFSPRGGLQVAAALADFVGAEALPGTGSAAAAFWTGVESLFRRFAP